MIRLEFKKEYLMSIQFFHVNLNTFSASTGGAVPFNLKLGAEISIINHL